MDRTIVESIFFVRYVPCVGYWQDIYRVSYKIIVHVHAIHVMSISFAYTYSRFTLIVDNTDPLLESRDFLDRQMISDIIGRHTVKHQHNITDVMLSSSDFEQVRM